MGENSKIEWTDHTFNAWYGCSKVSPACDHCYAEAWAMRSGLVEWEGDRRRSSPTYWKKPLAWNAAAEAAGKNATVFCNSLGDIWDKEADPIWRRDLFALMDVTPHLTWLLLSKRIGNADRMTDPLHGNPVLPPNAALGATVINQTEWDRDAPKLERARDVLGAVFSFVSIEPMLGPIDMGGKLPGWVIAGGESGPHARPAHPAWFFSLCDQCAAADVPFFFKQWGEYAPSPYPMSNPAVVHVTMDGRQQDFPLIDSYSMRRVGKVRAGHLLDGVEHHAFPVTP